MNWLLIFVLLFIAGNVIWGYRRGFLRVAYSLAEWLLILIAVTWAAPYVNQFLSEHTGIPAAVAAYSKEELRQSVLKEDAQGDAGELNAPAAQEVEDLEIFGIKLPDVIADNLMDSEQAADHFLENTGVYDLMAGKIADLAMQGIAFLITLIAVFFIFRGIGIALKLVDRIPILNGVNRTAGLFAGFVKGLLFVWIAFAFLAAGAGTPGGKWLISFVYESPVLAWFYEQNPVFHLLVHFL